jgi:SnoaL-like domain
MSTLDERPAKLPLRAAMEARDLAAVMDAFAPEAIFHSPFTEKLTFRGRDEIGALSQIVLEVFEDFRYTDELRGENAAFLVARGRVDGQEIEMVDHIRLGPDGKIRELTVFFRPLPATAIALRLLGAGLGRRRSPIRAAIISGLTRPLGFMTRVGDGIGVRLVRPAL